MIYRKQTAGACIAYALWQLGLVPGKAMAEYRHALVMGNGWGPIEAWCNKYCPAFWEATSKLRDGVMMRGVHMPKDGRGVLLVAIDGYSLHAVSYESGAIMDPETDAPGHAESWAQFQHRYVKQGFSPVIILAARL